MDDFQNADDALEGGGEHVIPQINESMLTGTGQEWQKRTQKRKINVDYLHDKTIQGMPLKDYIKLPKEVRTAAKQAEKRRLLRQIQTVAVASPVEQPPAQTTTTPAYVEQKPLTQRIKDKVVGWMPKKPSQLEPTQT